MELRAYVTVWDLLPASRLTSAGYYLGIGAYHSAVQIEDLGVEFAFGGHTVPRVSGIFGLACEKDISKDPPRPPMPGLRFVQRVDMGPVFPERKQRQADEEDTARLLKDEEQDLQHLAPGVDLATLSERDVLVLKVLSVIERMKAEGEWYGTSYSLLSHNCNHFTAELIFRLTGKHIPSWINRAASFALAFPCLIPPAFIDPPTAEEGEAVASAGGVPVPSGLQPDEAEYKAAEMVAPS